MVLLNADRPVSLSKLKASIGALCLALSLIGCSDKRVPQISAGAAHSLALIGGKVYAAGDNEYGQLGLGDKTDRDTFTEVTSLSDKNIIAVSARYKHSLALAKDGKLYGSGSNDGGALGLGGKADRASFVKIPFPNDEKIAAIAAGYDCSFALSKEGKLYAAGLNISGQLGFDDKVKNHTFAEITSLSGKNIIAVAIGLHHSLALSNDGKVYSAGWNHFGQLGLNGGNSRDIFTEVTSLNGKNIIAIAAGSAHSLALDKEGKVYAAGLNGAGQLGLGDTESENDRDAFTEVTSLSDKNIIAIYALGAHSLALSKEGKVYGAGYNKYGGLGLGDKTNRKIFTEVTSLSDKNIIAIAAGAAHSLALDKEGKLYATGDNEYGQLGLNDKTDRDTFTLVPIGGKK